MSPRTELQETAISRDRVNDHVVPEGEVHLLKTIAGLGAIL